MGKTYPGALKSAGIRYLVPMLLKVLGQLFLHKGMRMTCPSAFKSAGIGPSIPVWRMTLY